MAVEVLDVVRITARMLLLGVSDVVNVYHFLVGRNNSADDLAFMVDVAEIMDDLYTLINTDVHENITYISVEGQNITKDELLPAVDWPVLIDGSQATEQLPEQLAICVFHRTAKPRVRAAKFLPPMGESSNAGGTINSATRTRVEAYGDSLQAGLTQTDVDLLYVAFNRLLAIATLTTQSVVPERFRTQRNRRLGVGS